MSTSRPDEAPTTTVTTLVATRDRPEMLRRALASITAQRGDFVHDVIVVFDQSEPDDGLVDEFPAVALRVVPNTHEPGLAGARNTGIDLADGEWIAFCDDDDWWVDGRLRRQLELVERRPGVDFVVTGISIEREGTSRVRTLDASEVTLGDLVRDRVMEAHPSTFLVRSAAIADYIGPVDESLPGSYAEDYDWLLRAARHAPIASTPEVLVHVQWHATSFFGNRWATIDDALAHLMAKTPEFADDPRGRARVLGQRSFANASLGRHREARRLWKQTWAASRREPRLATAALVLSRLVSGDRLSRWLNAAGYGF